MKNKLFNNARALFVSLPGLLLISSQVQAHPGHEHQHDFAYMITHSLTHAGLFLVPAVIIAAIVFYLRKRQMNK